MNITKLFYPMRMVCCRTAQLFVGALRSHPLDFIRDAYLWANVFYVSAAVGYLVTDLSAQSSYVLLFFLAVLYVVSAVLYWMSWSGAWPHPPKSAIAGEYLNMVASLGFVCTACAYPFEHNPLTLDSVYGGITVAEAILATVFVIDALLYAWAWHVGVLPVSGHRGWTVR